MTLAWQVQLPSSDKLVLLALADNANDEGHCFPSVATLMDKCGMGERTVQDIIARLKSADHVTCHYRTGRSTVYTVHPRINRTGAVAAPPQQPHPTPAVAAPPPPHFAAPRGAVAAPLTSTQPSIEPSLNPQGARKRASTASRLPEDFGLNPQREAIAKAEGVSAEREMARFCDHWCAASGANARKLDWDAAWRNWCRRAADFRKPQGAPSEPVRTWEPPEDEHATP